MKTTAERTATELTTHRYLSPIGTTQRHYRVNPALPCDRGAFTSLVLVPGESATFVFPADADGEIADFEALAKVAGVTDTVAALAHLGYYVSSAAEQR